MSFRLSRTRAATRVLAEPSRRSLSQDESEHRLLQVAGAIFAEMIYGYVLHPTTCLYECGQPYRNVCNVMCDEAQLAAPHGHPHMDGTLQSTPQFAMLLRDADLCLAPLCDSHPYARPGRPAGHGSSAQLGSEYVTSASQTRRPPCSLEMLQMASQSRNGMQRGHSAPGLPRASQGPFSRSWHGL